MESIVLAIVVLLFLRIYDYLAKEEYPCDDCPSDGRCSKHSSCAPYQKWRKEYK